MAERNPFLEVKTIVQPTASPVDTFVQPAPVDDTRLRELSTFLNNMTPRVERYAQIERGRKDKKDITRAKKAYADLLDLNLSYDELVKKGEISPEESPVFRYAYHEAKGESLGYSFIQKASEAYFKSNLVGKTSTAGFDNWFNNYKKAFIKNNEITLNELGAFDPFNNLTKQAQSSLMNQHLANVRKNVAKGASDTSLKLIRQIANNALAKAGGDPSQVDWKTIGTIIHAKRSELAKVSKKPFKEINDETLEDLSKLFAGFDNPIYFENLISGMKTSGGASLGDTLQGRAFIADLNSEINKNLNTQTTRNNNIRKENSLATQAIFNRTLKPLVSLPIEELKNETVMFLEEGTSDGYYERTIGQIAGQIGIDLDTVADDTQKLNGTQLISILKAAANEGDPIINFGGVGLNGQGEELRTLIFDQVANNSNPSWQADLSKELDTFIEAKNKATELSGEYLGRWKKVLRELGVDSGTAYDYYERIIAPLALTDKDSRYLLEYAERMDQVFKDRIEAQTKAEIAEEKRIEIRDESRNYTSNQAITKDKANALDDPVFKDTLRGLLRIQQTDAESLNLLFIQDQDAFDKYNRFIDSYLYLDHENYFNLPQREKRELLKGLRQDILDDMKRNQTIKPTHRYVPLFHDNGDLRYGSDGFVLYEKIDIRD